jgi:DNA-binding transcriptional MerR regulator
MLINEVSKNANLTKKAIEYYMEQELIFPTVLENGYRDFNQSDVERLKRISLFRKLGLSVQDIKTILADDTLENLQKIAIQKELSVQIEQAKKAVLDKLCRGQNYSEISADLEAIEFSATIAEKLLQAFPGYYGRFICLHFARFLNVPISTDEERLVYSEIIAFLDNIPSMVFPEDVQTFLDENTKDYSPYVISSLLENAKQSIENPEAFLLSNKEMLEQYFEFKQSDEYKDSPLGKTRGLFKEFNSSIGYYDFFIPAIRKLSKSYAEYSHQMEIANEKLLSHFPEIKKLFGGE